MLKFVFNLYRTDIGGSLRIPAHYSGCFSLKTCFGRLPDKGLSGPSRGFESVLSSAGPMYAVFPLNNNPDADEQGPMRRRSDFSLEGAFRRRH
jgi:hypothetical protein